MPHFFFEVDLRNLRKKCSEQGRSDFDLKLCEIIEDERLIKSGRTSPDREFVRTKLRVLQNFEASQYVCDTSASASGGGRAIPDFRFRHNFKWEDTFTHKRYVNLRCLLYKNLSLAANGCFESPFFRTRHRSRLHIKLLSTSCTKYVTL